MISVSKDDFTIKVVNLIKKKLLIRYQWPSLDFTKFRLFVVVLVNITGSVFFSHLLLFSIKPDSSIMKPENFSSQYEQKTVHFYVHAN